MLRAIYMTDSSTHPRNSCPPLSPPKKDLILLPLPGKENCYKEQGSFPRYLGGTSPWENPKTKINSPHLCDILINREEKMEKGKADWNMSSAFYQDSHVTHCSISFLGLFFHPETGHYHKPYGKHGSWEGSQSTEKMHLDNVKITHKTCIHTSTDYNTWKKVSSFTHTYKLFHCNP